MPAYGSLLLDKTKYPRVRYTKDEKMVSKLLQDPMTKKVSELPGGLFEVEMNPRRVQQTTPTVLGVHVLSQAKLVLLKYFYQFIDR